MFDEVISQNKDNPLLTHASFTEIFGTNSVDKVYKQGIKFYKDKERCGELQIDYQLRLQFMAYSKQAKYGNFREDAADCGWFDLVGNDARKEWKKLGVLSAEEAMLEFVRLLDAVCPTFRAHVKDQHKAIAENLADKSTAFSPNTLASQHLQHHLALNGGGNSLEQAVPSKEQIQKFEQQKKLIQIALNKQTYHQFLAYAQQTHPGEPEKQEDLIKQLQEQHYEQYMAQVYAQQQAAAQVQAAAAAAAARSGATLDSRDNSTSDSEAGVKPAEIYLHQGLERPPPGDKVRSVDEEGDDGEESDVSDEEANDEPPNPKIAPATMWNSKDIQDFKAAIKKEGPEGILKVGHGETVTVRVPTHPEGNSLFWEFATDHYDIGFGVYFEWTIAESNQVTVQVEESEDEYDEEAESSAAATAAASAGDVESGAAGAGGKPRDPNKPQIDEIIPVFRRDCHQEVFAGSHAYPGRGVYLLKFDNSYSLWRSKTLYYRVFYSK